MAVSHGEYENPIGFQRKIAERVLVRNSMSQVGGAADAATSNEPSIARHVLPDVLRARGKR